MTLHSLSCDPLAPKTQVEADLMQAFQDASLYGSHLTPQQRVEMYEPKNPYEARLKELTIYRYKVLDFMQRHPDATNVCLNLLSAAAQGLQAIKYAGAAVGGFTA